jgi:manganese/zinc/iron transport system substrate-binding protein
MKIKLVVAACICFLLIAMTGCSQKEKNKGKSESVESLSDKTIEVVCTTTMITDLVRNIGGERVNVQGLMGPGIDPHLYKASEGDVSRMSRADVIVYNGLHLEGKMTEIFKQMQQRKKTFAVTEGVDESRLLSPPEFEGAHDPHIWFDVSLWMEAAEYVKQSFIELDPEHGDVYERNADAYIQKINELHAFIKEEVQKVPQDKRVIITAHDAFNYFGSAYGFDVRGLQGISTAAEAGTADVKELAEFIVEKQIPAIFVETSVPERYIEALQEAVRSRGFDVKIGGSLFSDALGSPDTPEGSYLGMVSYNVRTIVQSLSS